MMAPSDLLLSLAGIAVEHIVNCLLGGTLLAAFAWLLLRVMPRQNSGTRFVIWFAALLGMAILPLWGGLGWRGVANGLSRGIATGGHALLLPRSWALPVFAGWAMVAALGLVRLAVGMVQVLKLRRECVPVNAEDLDPMLRELLHQLSPRRSVMLCVSDSIQVPTAMGFLRPAVVLPTGLMGELPATEVRQILLHEFAHLRRWDDWTNLVQKILKAVFFFHPAIWWIEQKVSLEREMACDDVVLAQSVDPRSYAECLTRLAERIFRRRGLALAQAAVNRIRQTSLRVARILDADRPAAAGICRPAVSAMAIFTLASLVSIGSMPRLVAFDSGGSDGVEAKVSAGAHPATSKAQVTLAAMHDMAAVRESAASKISGAGEPLPAAPKFVDLKFVTLKSVALKMQTSPSGPRAPSGLPAHANGLLVQQAMLRISSPDDAGVQRRVPRAISTRASVDGQHLGRQEMDGNSLSGNAFYGYRSSASGFSTPGVSGSNAWQAQEVVFVVMESQDSGAPDSLTWRVHMWQLIVFHPVQDSGMTETPQRSI